MNALRNSFAAELPHRARAALVHLGVSLVAAVAVATLIFYLWYPWPYRILSGGSHLFVLIASVDVVIGPMLTFVIFNRAKPWRELRRDLIVIGLLQMGALLYGVHTMYVARPVALVYEVDRLRVVTDADVQAGELPQAPPGLRHLPLAGVRLLSTRQARNGDERLKALDMALQGVDVSLRPSFWVAPLGAAEPALARAKSIDTMKKQYPQQTAVIDAAVAEAGVPPAQLKFLPVMARVATWSALVDVATGKPVGFVPLDGFF